MRSGYHMYCFIVVAGVVSVSDTCWDPGVVWGCSLMPSLPIRRCMCGDSL